jgi:hypothetical protein
MNNIHGKEKLLYVQEKVSFKMPKDHMCKKKFVFVGIFVMFNCVSFFYRSSVHPPFWIPIHIVIPERPTENAVFNVVAGTLMS